MFLQWWYSGHTPPLIINLPTEKESVLILIKYCRSKKSSQYVFTSQAVLPIILNIDRALG